MTFDGFLSFLKANLETLRQIAFENKTVDSVVIKWKKFILTNRYFSLILLCCFNFFLFFFSSYPLNSLTCLYCSAHDLVFYLFILSVTLTVSLIAVN